MKLKRACVVINPHAGQNVTKIPDLIAVLAAAGWSTEIMIKEYGGHSVELAASAAKANYDLVIGYGGDGTLNQVLNGVMSSEKHASIIGVIPGGTANVWAADIGVPSDPVQAALALCNSEARKIDIGHVEVQGLSFPGTSRDDQEPQQKKNDKRVQKKEVKETSRAKHHFMLWAGLGFDAAIMEHVSKALKYRVGLLAVGLAVVEELPKQHPFPIEIRVGDAKQEDEKIWKGEAFQVVIGNTRRYANLVQMTPNAYLDNGLLDVCVITAGNTWKTIEEIASLVFRRKPDNVTNQYFQGASITISVPASIGLQLDGSVVSLDDYLNKADRKALQSAGNAAQVMVTYRFDAMPRAVQVAIPSTYDGALFQQPLAEEKPLIHAEKQKVAGAAQQNLEQVAEEQIEVAEEQVESQEQVATISAHKHRITVRGVTYRPQKQHTYIIAGTVSHHMTGDTTPVALCVDERVTIFRQTDEQISIEMIRELRKGAVIFAEGKKNKYGVIRATRVVI
jgi:YegS/Rv2252/BmrU family lipid kinase